MPTLKEEDPPKEKEEKQQAEIQQLLLAVLKGLVSVNSFFTGIVFLGLTFKPDTQGQQRNGGRCEARDEIIERVVQFEVVAFSCFLFSTLIAQGLKLQMILLVLKHTPRPHSIINTSPNLQKCCPHFNIPNLPQTPHTNHINPTLLISGMLMSVLGSTVGTLFLMLSIIYIVQARLGTFHCTGSKSTLALYPFFTFIPVGVFCFLSPVLYAVFTFKRTFSRPLN